ncbi:MAG TPA: DUF3341 domain-containing protein [Stellaceae bacterium]|jgi:hypothetical protein|nr:DUF3341 domain-containing protein [Stellaceae bacterium]
MSAIVAVFADEAACVKAATRLRDDGLRRVEAYTPYPVEALDAVLSRPRMALPLIVFAGGMIGLALGFGMQWYADTIGYPLNIGGRPFASWPAFIPIAFEIAVLGAVLSGFIGFLVLARLPKPYQPVAAIDGFERASQDRFFLVIENDPADPAAIRSMLEEFAPCSVTPWPS